jgi:hypothetical protein
VPIDPIRPVEPRRDVAPLERVQLSPIEREEQRRRREERRRKRRTPSSPRAADQPREGLDIQA